MGGSITCSFHLNDEPMSRFNVGDASFDAFSGLGAHINKRSFACVESVGPIPLGRYFILDRPSGGRLGGVRDWISGRDRWFALFAADGSVDDETLCEKVTRGSFRLHPKGPAGISYGCIVIDSLRDYEALRRLIVSATQVDVPGTSLKAYGTVDVT